MDFETIPAKELDRYVREGWLIIDLRSPQEYQEKHIKGAVNIPFEKMEELYTLGKQQKMVLYCERGAMSMAAARELAAKNYRVKTVVGGIRAYRGFLQVSENNRESEK